MSLHDQGPFYDITTSLIFRRIKFLITAYATFDVKYAPPIGSLPIKNDCIIH